jgi:hypothetical protein
MSTRVSVMQVLPISNRNHMDFFAASLTSFSPFAPVQKIRLLTLSSLYNSLSV